MKRIEGMLGLAAVAALAGCGGGGGGMSSGGGTTGGSGSQNSGITGSPSVLAATFQVDVNSGQVSVISQKGSLSGSARLKPGMFTGNSIGFQSSQLTNDALGGTGVRALQVSLVNNTDMTVGVDRTGISSGLSVIFGAFENTTGIQDQRPNTHVSTFAGSAPGFLDGSTTTALMKEPAGTAFGADGSVYVADFGNNRIRKIKSGFVSTLAGSGAATEKDGGATTAAFNGPYALAVNPADGSLIVADFNGNTIRRVTTTGVVNTIAGTGTAGSANGAGNAATFTNPSGVAADSSGNIYVSEEGLNHIRKIVLSGGSPTLSSHYTVSAYAGSGTAGLVDGPGASAEFFKPYGLACDASGNLYVADYSNNAIRMVDTSMNVTTIAGTGTQSDLDGYGNAATFNRPFGIASANGALFVTDSGGDRIREVIPAPSGGNTPSSWIVETLAGTGSAGSSNGSGSSATFSSPYGVASSAGSSLFVADFVNNEVREVNPSTGTFPIGAVGVSTSSEPVQLSNATGIIDNTDLGSSPYINYAGSLGPGQTSSAQEWDFVIPSGVTSFQFQVMVEANTSELLPLQSAVGQGSPNVDVRTFSGAWITAGYQDGGATTTQFNNPLQMAMDEHGVLYVCDLVNQAIRRIDPAGNSSTIAGSRGAPGSTNGPGNTATFNSPFGVAVSPDGSEVFVTDQLNNEIRRISFNGGDPTNAANWNVTTIAGTTTAGFANGLGNAAGFAAPTGILLLTPNELYVSEFDGNRVRGIRFLGGDRSLATNWTVSPIAGDDSGTNGATGTTNGQGSAARFSGPEGMCTDGHGNVYLADETNAMIRKIDEGANVTTFAGNGTAGYQDGPGASAEFNFDSSIVCDTSGYFYVADGVNGRIRRISPSGQVTTVAGNGTQAHLDGPGNTAEFVFPFGLAISPSGTLYVACELESDIRIVQTAVASASPSQRSK